MIDYVPPKDVNMEKLKPAYYIYANEVRPTSTTFEIPQTREFKEKPTDEDLMRYAKDLKNLFSDGFQWGDLGKIISISNKNILKYPMSSTDKKDSLIKIFDYLIDITDTPYLPDRISDPFMKKLVPSFVEMVISKFVYFSDPVEGKPDEKALEDYAKKVKNLFDDGFQWADIPKITYLAIDFAHGFYTLSKEEKAKIVKYIIDYAIDHTHAFVIGDSIADRILKSITHSIIDEISDKL